MKKRAPAVVARLAAIPTAGLGDAPAGFETVREILQRFGYLQAVDPAKAAPAVLDSVVSHALVMYQKQHGLAASGIFDLPTKEMMAMPRCGMPDHPSDSPLAFSTSCAWVNRDSLTYAFESGTADINGDDERQAVRNALATWSATVQMSFREVGPGDNPDILVAWRQANEVDRDMRGTVVAHADFPPGCGIINNSLPRPLHFDDEENSWCIGAQAGALDVETVALHELGHLLGLQHSSVAGAVMFPTVSANSTNRVLSPDDVEGVRRLYPLTGPIFARHSGRCLDVEAISTAGGAHLIQWDYWGGWNQLFRVEWVESRHYRLVAQHSGKVVDVEGISTANGAHTIQWDWWGGDNQKFRLDPQGHGYYDLVAKHSGRVVDVEAISTELGAHAIQWDWWGGDNQRWRLGPAAIFSRHSGKCLDVEGISLANGAALIQWNYWGGGNQRFRLDPVGDGYYRILIEHTGKCLDVEGISTANGARVIQWEYWGGDNQKFRPEPVGDGYYKLVAKHSGRCLDVAGISTADGAGIIQWDYWGGGNQQWRL
jgi:hypothetical protein